ncbi:MAG TPA: hypothetical protein VN605_12635 [Thermoanaerobaculia bacterium]|nr:hypothetical protein [Thermoanaerobaculia bacterium]
MIHLRVVEPNPVDIAAQMSRTYDLFERFEPGSRRPTSRRRSARCNTADECVVLHAANLPSFNVYLIISFVLYQTAKNHVKRRSCEAFEGIAKHLRARGSDAGERFNQYSTVGNDNQNVNLARPSSRGATLVEHLHADRKSARSDVPGSVDRDSRDTVAFENCSEPLE